MFRVRSPIPWLPLALLCLGLCLPGCGAGLVTGIAANQGGGSSAAAARRPELALSPVLPLVPAPNTVRSVVVSNAAVPGAARLQIVLEAAGRTAVQGSPTVGGQGGAATLTFVLDTGPILAGVAEPTAGDVPGRLRVLVDGRDLAPPASVVLVRQLTAALEQAPPPAAQFVSPLGARVQVRLVGLRHADPANLQLLASTRDPEVPTGRIVRICAGLELVPTGIPGQAVVTASVPGNEFPDRFELFVRDAVSGQSTVAGNAYYRPDVVLALPSQGSTTGGALVTLIGTALVPHDFGAGRVPAPLSFAAVSLWVRKGGRESPVPRVDLRVADSGRDRLVFTMPGAPDGRPGQVDIVLRTQLDGAVAEVVAGSLFLYANPDPVFGPRGAVLPQAPVAVVPIHLDSAPRSDDAPDFAVLGEEGGVGVLQLMLGLENGMFQRFGARRTVANAELPAERGPVDLTAGDFDGDGVPDLFVANAGSLSAVHKVVLGQTRPLPPLGEVFGVPGAPGSGRCAAADFDGDGRSDVLLVPGLTAPVGSRPQVLLARPLAQGQPAFAPPIDLPVREFAYEAFAIADLDGDGVLDVAVVSGTTLQLDVAYGLGDGSFAPAVPLDFAVPGYTPDTKSPAVGLHACRNGVLQALGLVLAGLTADPLGSGPTPPVIAVLRQTTARSFAPPASAETQVIPSDPLATSLAENLDQAGPIELAVGVRGVPTLASVGLFRLSAAAGFQVIQGGVETGAELPRNITALHFARAFPATPLTGEAKALYVVHDSIVEGETERRLSTRLLVADGTAQSLVLLPPDAGAAWDKDVEGIVGGNFRPISIAGAGAVRDLALARSNGVDLLENDGFGGVPRPVGSMDAPGLLGRTLRLWPAPAGQVDRLVFLDSASRIGVWRPDATRPSPQVPQQRSGELRLLAADPRLQAAVPAADSQLAVEDVDGDGHLDLVVLLRFDLPARGEGDAVLLVLRGKVDPQPNEFPWYEPSAVTAVHGNASAFALGDFAAAGVGFLARAELALAVPVGTIPGAIDGNHVRFYRLVPGVSPAEDVFAPSARSEGPQVLIAGSGPARLAARDFDGDGLVDLLVASGGDRTLHLYRNTAPVTGAHGEVDVAAFVESLSSPRQLPTGTPRELRLADVDGDGSIDAIAVVERTIAGQRSTTVVYYLTSEPGVLAERRPVSASRLGDRNAALALDVGDWNRDGVLDLFLGWNTHGVGDRNVRVLFGGSR
jgi:hypothetical protein